MNLLLAAAENEIKLGAPTGWTNLSGEAFTAGNLVSSLISIVMVIAAVLFFFMLVIGGIRWITSGGDKGQTEGARNQITAALVGLVIVFSAWAIIKLIGTFFGVNLLNLTFKSTITP